MFYTECTVLLPYRSTLCSTYNVTAIQKYFRQGVPCWYHTEIPCTGCTVLPPFASASYNLQFGRKCNKEFVEGIFAYCLSDFVMWYKACTGFDQWEAGTVLTVRLRAITYIRGFSVFVLSWLGRALHLSSNLTRKPTNFLSCMILENCRAGGTDPGRHFKRATKICTLE